MPSRFGAVPGVLVTKVDVPPWMAGTVPVVVLGVPVGMLGQWTGRVAYPKPPRLKPIQPPPVGPRRIAATLAVRLKHRRRRRAPDLATPHALHYASHLSL